ncbi:Eaa1 [Klebsiella pneumoniae]|nr:DUF551 domain-containing protein [Klebsiella pneumoniae]SYE22465.1 Eaa1 [Klebsiella pneumoniae]
MTSKLTREQLHERARENVKALKMASRQTAFESAREEILADLQLAELVLAAMDGEPVAWTWHYREQWHVTNDERRASFVAKDGDVAVLPLYRHAQPVPVVSADLLHTAASAIEDLLEHTDPNTSYYSGVWADVPGKLRAAMFQAKSLTGNSPVIGIDLASGPDRTVEVHYVAPPGYVMVPKEPTEAMMLHNSGCQHHAWDDPDCAMRQTRRLIWSHMLAAAPQLPGSDPATVPGKWIPVSERMPDENAEQQLLACFKGGDISTLYYFEGRWDDAYGIVPIRQDVTHWMPLPAGPKEVQGE